MTNTGKQSTIKLAAIDLDGTLLDGREQIPTKTRRSSDHSPAKRAAHRAVQRAKPI